MTSSKGKGMNMEATLEQSFVIELELLISYYINKGVAPGVLEEHTYEAIENMFENFSSKNEE
jgi:hypothetical protein